MSQWSFTQFQSELQKKHISSIYFLYGEESYLLDEAFKALSDAVLDNSLKDFNLNVFYADQVSALQIEETVKTLPVSATKRMVVLKGASKFKQLDHLLPLIEDPVSSCVFVLIDHQIDQRRKFFKVLGQKGVLVNCSSLKEAQLPTWIQKVALRLGKNIDLQTCRLLLERVGPSMLDLHNEIMKLVQFVGQRQQITAKDVQNVVSKQYLESIFDLVNALGSYNALILLKSLLYQGQSEVGILAMLSRQVRIFLLIKEALAEKMPAGHISKRVGVPTYFLKQYMQQSRSWTTKQLQSFHTLLLQTDLLLKRSSLPKHLLMEICILKASQIREQKY